MFPLTCFAKVENDAILGRLAFLCLTFSNREYIFGLTHGCHSYSGTHYIPSKWVCHLWPYTSTTLCSNTKLLFKPGQSEQGFIPVCHEANWLLQQWNYKSKLLILWNYTVRKCRESERGKNKRKLKFLTSFQKLTIVFWTLLTLKANSEILYSLCGFSVEDA